MKKLAFHVYIFIITQFHARGDIQSSITEVTKSHSRRRSEPLHDLFLQTITSVFFEVLGVKSELFPNLFFT